jgi:hypothetical protein
MKMKRTNYHYPARTLARLRILKKKTGIPVNELIRRAVDRYLKHLNQGGKP